MEYKDVIGQPLQEGDIVIVNGPSSKDTQLFPVFFQIESLISDYNWGAVTARAINKVAELQRKSLCVRGGCSPEMVLKLEKEMMEWAPDALRLHLKVLGVNFTDE